ncbi:DUF2996 domain-containing protein [Halomicronema hongdechloris]|nr:DUF2996 domain-containing protein [Halomicronema hongdechloris]
MPNKTNQSSSQPSEQTSSKQVSNQDENGASGKSSAKTTNPSANQGSASKNSAKAKGDSAKAKKKEKPPEPEEKPFQEFIRQHYLPDLEQALKGEGLEDIQLEFDQQPLPVVGADPATEYWQVRGRWQGGKRWFAIAFTKEDIKGPKLFSYADNGAKPSTIEQFMGDERKVNLGLMVLYAVQRLNAQKWLTRN